MRLLLKLRSAFSHLLQVGKRAFELRPEALQVGFDRGQIGLVRLVLRRHATDLGCRAPTLAQAIPAAPMAHNASVEIILRCSHRFSRGRRCREKMISRRRKASAVSSARKGRGSVEPPFAGRWTGAGRGNRTLVFSLEGCCSTIELYPRAGLPLRENAPEVYRLSASRSARTAAKTLWNISSVSRPVFVLYRLQ